MPLRIKQVLGDDFTEPITLLEAKSWMQITYDDWDDLIEKDLIPSARIQSEKQSGQAYTERTIEVTGNAMEERIYPIGPWIEDLTENTAEIVDYSYKAGFNDINLLPNDLKIAMLKRIATDFAMKQNGMSEQAYENAISGSVVIENRYREDLFI